MQGIVVFFQGLGFKNIRPALYAWFFNFFFSLFIYFACYRWLSDAAGETRNAAEAAGGISLFTFLADLVHGHRGILPLLIALALFAALLFLLVSIFVAGGIYSVLVGEERTTFSNLIASSLENFPRMLKAFLVNILNWAVTLLIPGILLVLFLHIEPLVINEAAWQVFTWAWAGITLLLFIFSTAIYDLTRIFRLREERNVFYAFKQAIRFTFSKKLCLLGLFLVYGVSLMILFLIYAVFQFFLENLLYALFIFIVYQGFILVRYFLKIAVMRAEVQMSGVNV
jgi:hypothetical protein